MWEGRISVHLRVPLAKVSLHSFSKFVFRQGKKKVTYTTKPFVLITKPSLGAIHSTKIPTGPRGKSGPPQKVDPFFRNFSRWTEPIFGLMDRAQTPIQYSHGRVGRCWNREEKCDVTLPR